MVSVESKAKYLFLDTLCAGEDAPADMRTSFLHAVVRNEDTPASDIDVLVEFREGEETFDHFMDLKFYLEDLLGRKTDLVIADTVKPRIRDSVLREVVYA